MTRRVVHACPLIVCEPQPRWSRLLRPIASEAGVRLREVRGLEQLWPLVEEAPGSVVCLHVTGDSFAKCMGAAQRMKQMHPVAIVALPVRALAPWSWRMYEFGVDHVVHSPLDVRAVAALIRRQARRRCVLGDIHEITPESHRNLLWKRLPWKRHATDGGN